MNAKMSDYPQSNDNDNDNDNDGTEGIPKEERYTVIIEQHTKEWAEVEVTARSSEEAQMKGLQTGGEIEEWNAGEVIEGTRKVRDATCTRTKIETRNEGTRTAIIMRIVEIKQPQEGIVERPQIVIFAGNTGSGKTTALREVAQSQTGEGPVLVIETTREIEAGDKDVTYVTIPIEKGERRRFLQDKAMNWILKNSDKEEATMIIGDLSLDTAWLFFPDPRGRMRILTTMQSHNLQSTKRRLEELAEGLRYSEYVEEVWNKSQVILMQRNQEKFERNIIEARFRNQAPSAIPHP